MDLEFLRVRLDAVALSFAALGEELQPEIHALSTMVAWLIWPGTCVCVRRRSTPLAPPHVTSCVRALTGSARTLTVGPRRAGACKRLVFLKHAYDVRAVLHLCV